MKVRITASERVNYSKIVEMTPEEFKEFEEFYEENKDGPLEITDLWMDVHNDIVDGDGAEDVWFEVLE